MIPALLSCLFVLYLYRTLNEPSGDDRANRSANSDSTVQSEIEGLEQELAQLRHRLQTLVAAQAGEKTE